MHKNFYASGFLYHASSGQILLQQNGQTDDTSLTLLCARGNFGQSPSEVFLQSIKKLLGISVHEKNIIPIYDYDHETMGSQYIFYVDISDTPEALHYTGDRVGWFPLAKLSKLNLSTQARHDIVIGSRVIRANEEKKNQTAANAA